MPAPALVNSASHDTGSSVASPATFLLPWTPAPGNTLIVLTRTGGTLADTATTVSDSVSDVMHRAVAVGAVTNCGYGFVDYADNIAGGTTTVSWAWTGGSTQHLRMAVLEVSGLDPTGSLDQFLGTAFNTATATPSSGPVTTTSASEFLVDYVFAGNNHAGDSISIAAPWTQDIQMTASNDILAVGHRVVSATGSYTASGTLTTADTCGCIIVTFKAPAAGAALAGTCAASASMIGGTLSVAQAVNASLLAAANNIGTLSLAQALGGSSFAVETNTGSLSVAVPMGPVETVVPSNRPHPGRGPFSKGKFFVQRRDAYTQAIAAANLSGSMGAVATFSGVLSNAQNYAASSLAVASLSGTSTISVGMGGALLSTAVNGGQLVNTVGLGGQIGAVGALAGTMQVAIAISGGSFAVESNTGNMAGGSIVPLSGLVGAVATVSGTLSVVNQLVSALSAVDTHTGALSLAVNFNGTVAAAAYNSGVLEDVLSLQATMSAQVVMFGVLVAIMVDAAATVMTVTQATDSLSIAQAQDTVEIFQ